jgi:type II secretory ATPase GspE/PulE/Tfp pilus assembly ATPase PilB-like protein
MRYELHEPRASGYKGVIDENSAVFLADSILYKAILMKASDIHLEPSSFRMRVRYRIDGILYDQKSTGKNIGEQVVSRIKILSSLNIAQRRLPQDGKLMIFCDRDIDLRISTFPTIFGEKMVIRILDRGERRISLESLGCSRAVLDGIMNIIKNNKRLFLVAGPTGSGKTTTLYAILSKLPVSEQNIVTLEDPVEYEIDGVTQSEVDEKIGFRFENGLRSLLRQDPDVLMVGEIRDRATAQIAVEAALTGHFVLSTLHTNDAVGAVVRLIDMGIEPFLLAGALSGVLAQTLVRRKCRLCDAKGCGKCFQLGHHGRTGLFELLHVDDKFRSLISRRASISEMQSYAEKSGIITMRLESF